jgi:hypothetical protein
MVVGAYRLFFTSADFESPNILLDDIIICISYGYFVYDFVFMCFLNLMEPAIGSHHIVAVILYFPILYTGYGGCITLISVLWVELSNPAMHIRVILKQYGHRHTKLYEALEIFYISTYMFGRCIMWTPIVWASLFSQNVPKTTAFSGAFLILQSYYFSSKMITILKGRYSQHKERVK